MRVRFGAATDIGQSRERNEDAYLAEPPLYAVADGMGGHRGGDVASSLALQILQEGAREGGLDRLAEAVRDANRAVFERSETDRTLSGMGTTLTVAVPDGRELHLAHVGDSRAYLLRDGELRQLTEDHTLVQRMVDEGKISEAEAEIHPQRSVLVRALGVDEEIDVDQTTIKLREGDRVLLCTDGLTGMVPEDQIRETLRTTADTQEAADTLVEEANRAGGQDNITVVILEFGPEEEPLETAAASLDGRPGKRPEKEQAERPRRGRRRIATWGIASLLLLGLLAVGLRMYLDRQWFVGIEGGRVAILRGLPTTVLGIKLFGVVSQTPLRANDAKRLALWRERLDEGISVESQEDADSVIRQIERDLAALQEENRSP